MARFFTTSPIAFYDDTIAPPPDGATAIDDADYTRLLAGQSSGQQLSVVNTQLVLIDVPPAAIPLTTQAMNALNESDKTMLRCFENGVAPPAVWVAYRAALRAVISGTSSTLPVQPAYPAGT